MLVRDTEKQAEIKRVDLRQAAAEARQEWALKALADSSMFQKDLNPTDPDAQMGRTMTSEYLTAKIRELNPALLVEFHPTRSEVVLVYRVLPRGSKIMAASFHRGILPEFSIHEEKVEYEEEPVPFDKDGNEVLSVGMVPQKQKDALKKTLDTIFNDPIKRYDETEAIALLERALADTQTDEKPYMKKMKRVGRELIRGWRTVLILLVREGLIRAVEVEKLFGGADRQSWAVKIGRRNETCLV